MCPLSPHFPTGRRRGGLALSVVEGVTGFRIRSLPPVAAGHCLVRDARHKMPDVCLPAVRPGLRDRYPLYPCAAFMCGRVEGLLELDDIAVVEPPRIGLGEYCFTNR